MSLLTKIPWRKAWEIAKKVGVWVVKAAKWVRDTYEKVEPIITTTKKVLGELNKGKQIVDKSLQLRKSDEDLTMAQRRVKFQLQQKTLELVIWSQTVTRFSNNIQLHAAQLNIHFESLQNTAAMADVILSHQNTLKDVVRLLNLQAAKSKSILIDESHLETNDLTAFNIRGQYDAFLRAQHLLRSECHAYEMALNQQLRKAKQIATAATGLLDKGDPMHKWIGRDVIPAIQKARERTQAMQKSLQAIPRLSLK